MFLGCGPRGSGGGLSKETVRVNEDKTAAHAALETGEYQTVIDLLTPWADGRSPDPQVYSMLAKAQWELGAQNDAIKNYEDALRLDYSDANVHSELARLLVEMGKTGRALTEFDLAVHYGASAPLVHYNYGLALYEMGRRDEALHEWKIACSLDGNDPRYVEALGIGLTGEDDRAALEYFERAAELGADGASFHNNFALLLQRLGDYARAEPEFKRALDEEPADETYRRNLALFYMVTRRFDAAVPLWEVLVHDAGENRTYRTYLARAYLEEECFESVIEVLGGWLDRTGVDPPGVNAGDAPSLDEAHGVLAMAYRGEGDFENALVWIRKALELKPDNVVYLNN